MSQIKNRDHICKRKNTPVKIYEIDLYFCENYNEKIQVDKNGYEYILFRIDVYFTEYFLAVEIDEKCHADRDFIFEKKKDKNH